LSQPYLPSKHLSRNLLQRRRCLPNSLLQGPRERSSLEPSAKKAKKEAPFTASSKLTQLLQRSVVRGKIIKVGYFQEQALEVFLDKLRAQGWLKLFTNTQLGCSVTDLAEFYANCSVTHGVVISEVNGKRMRFDAKKLGEILGVLATGFDIYIREDKSVLGNTRLLEFSQRLS